MAPVRTKNKKRKESVCNMKKKILAMAMALVIVLSLAACGRKTDEGLNPDLTGRDITPELLLQHGIPRDRTMYYHVDMVLKSTVAVDVTESSSVSGDIRSDFTLDADMVSDPINATSKTDGLMNIKGYGMDMDYPMLSYSRKDVIWEQDSDTQQWYVYEDPDYVTNETEGILGLTPENFSQLVLNGDGPEYRLDGILDLNVANPVTGIVTSLVGHSAPDVEAKITITFDKKTCRMTGLEIRIDDGGTNGACDFTLESFEYIVNVEKFDDTPLELPADLPEPDTTERYQPDLSDGIEVLEPESDDGSDDLVFVIPSDLSEG